jgi:hypothetical protein
LRVGADEGCGNPLALRARAREAEHGLRDVDAHGVTLAAEPACQGERGATGGAVIGPRSSLSLSIVDNDPLPGGGGNGNNDDGGDGGGGRVGWLSLLLLGMTRWLRRRSTTTG